MIETIKIFKNMKVNNIIQTMNLVVKLFRITQKKTVMEVKNRLKIGDMLEILIPNQLESYCFTIDQLWDSETDEEVEFVNPGKAGQNRKIHVPIPVKKTGF